MLIVWLFVLFVSHNGYTSGLKEKIVKENDELNICCRKNELIRIESAFYGYNSNDLCTINEEHEDCTVPNMQNFLSNKCSDRQCCKLLVNEEDFDQYGHCNETSKKYLKFSYRCVRKQHCPEFEHFSVAASVCPLTCPPITYYFLPCETNPGCICDDGLVRDHLTNKCVDTELCPYYNYDNPDDLQFEYYDDCVFKCPERCRNCTEPNSCLWIKEICRPGYKCYDNYCRKDGLCQPKIDCRD